jgi:hypothetical protein
MEEQRFLTIHYMDGTSDSFTFSKQAKDDYDLATRLKKALTADRIVMEMEGVLTIIPMSAVKRMDFSPVVGSLPEDVIQGVEPYEGY